MKKVTEVAGQAYPLNRADVDTDQIIPKQFLKSIKRTGYGENCFDAWRYLDTGQPGMDNSRRPLNPDFILNNTLSYRTATFFGNLSWKHMGERAGNIASVITLPRFNQFNLTVGYTISRTRSVNLNVNNVLGLNSDQGNSYTWPRKTEPRQYVTTVTTNF